VAELVDAGDLKARRKGRQVSAVLACRPLCFPRIPRSTVISDGSGHPGGHIFPCASTVQVASCASAASGMGGPELSWLSVFLGEKRNGGGNGGQVPAGHFASGHRDSGGVAKRVRRLTSRRERAAGQCSLGLPPWSPMGDGLEVTGPSRCPAGPSCGPARSAPVSRTAAWRRRRDPVPWKSSSAPCPGAHPGQSRDQWNHPRS